MSRTHPLPRTSPEAQGVASGAIQAFFQAAERGIHDLHSLMLLRHGAVIAEGWWSPYAPDRAHMLFSLSKSFTSTAVGLAVAEGRLSVDDPVLRFFPEEAPAKPSANLAALRVRDLLTMSTGQATDPTSARHQNPDDNWARMFFAEPVVHEPGTQFLYNSGASYMLSAIVQGLTGQTLLDYLRPRLLDPLGIVGGTWESCPRGINAGGWGLNIRTEDIARFGQLYLQRGVWQGERLLPEAWVEAATSAQIANGTPSESDWTQGYGYQFWRCRHGAYRGDGAFGQFCVVLPEQDAVLAITAGVANMQAVLDLVWEHLLPAMAPAPLAEDHAARERLAATLSGLALPLPHGRPSSVTAARVTGRSYAVEPNEQGVETIECAFERDRTVLQLRDGRGEHALVAGVGEWLRGESMFELPVAARTSASGAWTADDTYVMLAYYDETPFRLTVTCRFVGDELHLDRQLNVSFGPTSRPRLVGRLGATAEG
jgi:CubicO group peptidase (beta-lactamase class C family)